MRPLTSFPIVTMLAACAFGLAALVLKSESGLAFASGLATAAGTAYQYQRDED